MTYGLRKLGPAPRREDPHLERVHQQGFRIYDHGPSERNPDALRVGNQFVAAESIAQHEVCDVARVSIFGSQPENVDSFAEFAFEPQLEQGEDARIEYPLIQLASASTLFACLFRSHQTSAKHAPSVESHPRNLVAGSPRLSRFE